MTQLKLYGFLLCPYVHRVRFALEHLKIPYEYVEIDLFKNKQKEQSYLSVNPFGKVPAISFNNEVTQFSYQANFLSFILNKTQIIYESLPLIEFLENQFGGVFPKDNVRKTQQRIWANYFDQNIVSKISSVFALLKTKDQEAIKKLANDIAENLRFFTQHSRLSERVKNNPNTYFEGNDLTYTDFAIIPNFRFLITTYEVIFKQPFFELIENDQYIKDFKKYYENAVSSPAYKAVSDNIKNLPARGENAVLDTLTFTPETFNFNVFFETYINLKFVS